jgi:Methyltransferase domain
MTIIPNSGELHNEQVGRDDRRRLHFVVSRGNLNDFARVPPIEGNGPPNAQTLRQLHSSNPYLNFDIVNHPEDLQGWNSYDNVFRDIIEQVRPRRIIEVGVWKGTASIHMAKVVRELGLRCEIICVDTWLGSPEHLLAGHSHDRYKSLRLCHGYPQLFYTFLANVIRSDVSDYIIPLPMTSESAAVVLERLGLRADLVHIDAAHEYEPALRDFRAYWKLLSARGILIGDDYLAKRSVTRAATEFAESVERPICGLFPKFVIARPANVKFSIAQH